MKIVELGPDDPSPEEFSGLTDVALRRWREPELGLYLAESEKVVRRALAAGHRPYSALAPRRWLAQAVALFEQADIPVYLGDDQRLEALTGFAVHRGVLAAFHRPQQPAPDQLLAGARLVVVIEDVVDHTNVGAIFRSVAGLGADAVLVTPRSADPLYRRSVRVSMGTVLQVPWARLPDWPESAVLLHRAGFELAALALRPDAVPLDRYARQRAHRVALLLGTEGDGLSHGALAAADRTLVLPMAHGVDSLNVAAAAAVAVWELTHPR